MQRSVQRMRSGFTLIELLVVVTIIVVLLAILMPAMQNARESANRATCASNLRQWGGALSSYTGDNQTVVPCTLITGGCPMNLLWTTGAGHGDQLSVDRIAPYLPGYQPGDVIMKANSTWRCPSTDFDVNQSASWLALGQVQMNYFFYGRVDEWTASASIPTDLTSIRLDQNKLLMSDLVYRWGFNSAWSYNHGVSGPSYADPLAGGPNRTGAPELSGTNQMFGDSHVTWKGAGLYNPTQMETVGANPIVASIIVTTPQIGYVQGSGTNVKYFY